MRKLVVTEFVSLDGVFEAPGPDGSTPFAGWTSPYGNEEFAEFKMAELREAAVQLLGRVTYEGFAKAWPQMNSDEFGQKMNSMPKYVVSDNLGSAEWENSHIIEGEVATQVQALKEGDDGTILVAGSGKLVRSLMHDGLVDEYRLMVFPVVLGVGGRLFDQGATAKLKLIEAKPFKTGVVVLRYEPATDAA